MSDFTAFPRATLKSYGKVTHPSDSTAPLSDSTALSSDFTHGEYTKPSDYNRYQQRALVLHQRKIKHFIAKLLAQPFMVLQTFLKSMQSTLKFFINDNCKMCKGS